MSPCPVDRLEIRLAGALAVAAALSGCELPESPSWDVDLTIPITNRVETFADLVTDAPNLSASIRSRLDAGDLAFLSEGPTSAGVVLDLAGTGDRAVRVHASDAIEVRAVARLRTRVEL